MTNSLLKVVFFFTEPTLLNESLLSHRLIDDLTKVAHLK